MAMTEETYYTTEEVAQMFRVTAASVRRWANEGLIRTALITPGGQRRYLAEDVKSFLTPKDEG